MSEVSRRCPYCKEVPYRTGGDDPFAVHGCKAGDQEEAVVERLSRWQSRPIEDELQAEINKLRQVLTSLTLAIPLDVIRVKVGNAFLDIEKVEVALEDAHNALKAGRDE